MTTHHKTDVKKGVKCIAANERYMILHLQHSVETSIGVIYCIKGMYVNNDCGGSIYEILKKCTLSVKKWSLYENRTFFWRIRVQGERKNGG